jgi:anti-anti-sigma factor
MQQPLGHFQLDWHDTTALIVMHGEIDRSNAESLGNDIVAKTDTAIQIVLDVGLLGYLDSAALTMIHRLVGLDKNLVIVAPAGSRARRLLEIAGMDTILSIVETQSAALTS